MPQPKPTLNKDQPKWVAKLKTLRLSASNRLKLFGVAVKRTANRRTFAYFFMVSFILLTSVGAGFIFPPAGLIVAGITCGLFGFLLGSE